MSGEGKRGDAPPAKQPRPSSTLLPPQPRRRSPLSGSVEAIPQSAAARNQSAGRSRSIGARGAARAAKFGGVKPAVDLSNGGVSVAVVRDGRTRRPEMALQPVEMSRFAPGNGMVPNASDSQDLGAQSRAFHPPLRATSGTNDTRFAGSGLAIESRPVARKWSRNVLKRLNSRPEMV